jgi:uncharacterized protein (TIGR02996 family)
MAAKLDERLTLERALLDAPDDRAAWAVYADHLQQSGDPWGERLSLALAAGESTGNRFMQLHDAVLRRADRSDIWSSSARLRASLELGWKIR